MELSVTKKNQLIEKTDIFMEDLSIDELFFINKIVVDRIKYLQKATALFDMAKFRVGEIVSFNNGSKFIKFNQKTVSLVTDDNEQWNVAPRLLVKKVNQTLNEL